MKKLAVVAVLMSSLSLSACGNKDIFATEYEFKTAEIRMLDGTIKKVNVKAWSRDTEANNIRVTATDGTVYYSSSDNIMLIDK